MCGRFNLVADPHQLAEMFELLREPEWPGPRFNLYPSLPILAIREQSAGMRTAELVRWGLLQKWSGERVGHTELSLARAESVASKSSFKEAFRQRRCLIPATGFYEWQRLAPTVKQVWHIFPAIGPVLAFAGIWETWTNADGVAVESCAILTTEPNHVMSAFSDRMPVILPSESFDVWLDPQQADPIALQALLLPCPDAWLACHPVSAFVNDPKNDSPKCIARAKPMRGLFDS